MSAALKPAPPRMTAAAFLAWTKDRPEDVRYELVAGQPAAMAPETLAHGRLKYHVARRLSDALETARLPCEVLVDSVGVQVGEDHLYIPDVIIRRGESPPPGERTVEPLVVVEVSSPSTQHLDHDAKLHGYFAVPSVRHYLIVHPETQHIVHHRRTEDGGIATSLGGERRIRLDPPGITLADIFPAA